MYTTLKSSTVARFAQRWHETGFPESANWTLAHGETRGLDGRRMRA
jgi:hypothetical protein